MKDLELSIELVPKGAWGNNLRTALSQKNWNILREKCIQKANHTCEICGYKTDELDAHEVWDFDISSKTQTLLNIIALCSKCHGVKHMRNSERLGYGENAKRHFLKVNNCNEMMFAKHVFKTKMLFEEKKSLFKSLPSSPVKLWMTPPKVISIDIDNYQGIIIVICRDTNKINWFLDGKIIKTKYNVVGKFKTELKVENLNGVKLQFKLSGDGGETYSKDFEIIP